MRGIGLVAELMDEWLREENYALTSLCENLYERLRLAQEARDNLTRRVTDLSLDLVEQQDMTRTQIDLNNQLMERIEYLEGFISRFGRSSGSISRREARLFFSDSESVSESESDMSLELET